MRSFYSLSLGFSSCIPEAPGRKKKPDGRLGKLQFRTCEIVAIYGVQKSGRFKTK